MSIVFESIPVGQNSLNVLQIEYVFANFTTLFPESNSKQTPARFSGFNPLLYPLN
jgi:hypothetical protein